MTKLHRIIWDSDTPSGRTFDLVVQAFIVASLITFPIETLPGLAPGTRRALNSFELVTVVFFTLEYALRLATAERRLKFLFSFSGLIDLLAILPFYLSTGLDLRTLRIFRLFRVFRTLKLLRYSRSIDRFKRAFVEVQEELIVFGIACGFLLYLSSIGIYYFERTVQPEKFASVFHAMWWSIATLTTVGYGDIYPMTAGGKVFTFFVLVVGLGVVAVPSGLMASALSRAVRPEEGELE